MTTSPFVYDTQQLFLSKNSSYTAPNACLCLVCLTLSHRCYKPVALARVTLLHHVFSCIVYLYARLSNITTQPKQNDLDMHAQSSIHVDQIKVNSIRTCKAVMQGGALLQQYASKWKLELVKVQLLISIV